jgi:hypothetical protein
MGLGIVPPQRKNTRRKTAKPAVYKLVRPRVAGGHRTRTIDSAKVGEGQRGQRGQDQLGVGLSGAGDT